MSTDDVIEGACLKNNTDFLGHEIIEPSCDGRSLSDSSYRLALTEDAVKTTPLRCRNVATER